MFKLPKNIFLMILGGMLICHQDTFFSAHASSSTDDNGGVPLKTDTNPCRPIRVNGKLVPTEPVYMPNFPVTLHGIKQHYVCKLSDITPPEVSGCPSNQTYTIPVGDSTTTYTFTWIPPTATDDAGIASIVPDHPSGLEVTLDNPITVTYTVTDGSSLNNTDCSFNLTVLRAVDSTPPEVSGCPQDQTYTIPVGDSTTTHTFTWTPPTATDDAGIKSIVPDHPSGLEVTIDNPITVTYTVTDHSGLTNTDCSFTLTAEATTKMFVTSSKDDYNKIFVADVKDDLIFTHIPATNAPGFLAYDHMDRKIYWTDWNEKRVYCADVDGGNRENVTNKNGYELRGIAIAQISRTLYIAYRSSKITSVSIEEGSPTPGTESNFVTGLSGYQRSLEVDEQQGYLYWTMRFWVYRKALDGTSNEEVVYKQPGQTFSLLNGISIDLSRDPRRIFFCDRDKKRSFYKDLHEGASVYDAVGLTSYLQVDGNRDAGTNLSDISHFNGALYWAKTSKPYGIAIMTDYEFSNRSYTIKATSNIESPYLLLVINLGP